MSALSSNVAQLSDVQSSSFSFNVIPNAITNFELQERYGREDIQVLASNNPACLLLTAAHNEYEPRPRKTIVPLGSDTATQLRTAYEECIHPAIVRILKEEVQDLKYFHALHPLRMGWESGGVNRASYPIVLLFVFAHGGVSADVAERILIFIDICQLTANDARSAEIPSGFNVIKHNPSIYNDQFPLPGASIGPRALVGCTGTLCGYLTHGSTTYAVTNCHVVNGAKNEVLGTMQPYRYEEGSTKHIIDSPSGADYAQSIEYLQFIVGECGADPGLLRKAQSHDCSFGYVEATSGSTLPDSEDNLRMDWALISCNPKFGALLQNKHRLVDVDTGGFWPIVEQKKYLTANGVSEQWITSTHRRFKQAPDFGRLVCQNFQSSDDPYLKPTSARSRFRVSQYNGMRSTLYIGDYGVTREHTFICPIPFTNFCGRGDSGSPVLDKDYNVVGMIWGVDGSHVDEVAYVTPLIEVLRDIEKRMDWEEGSCTWMSRCDNKCLVHVLSR